MFDVQPGRVRAFGSAATPIAARLRRRQNATGALQIVAQMAGEPPRVSAVSVTRTPGDVVNGGGTRLAAHPLRVDRGHSTPYITAA